MPQISEKYPKVPNYWGRIFKNVFSHCITTPHSQRENTTLRQVRDKGDGLCALSNISGKSTTKSGKVSTFSVRIGNHFSMECAIISQFVPNGVTQWRSYTVALGILYSDRFLWVYFLYYIIYYNILYNIYRIIEILKLRREQMKRRNGVTA